MEQDVACETIESIVTATKKLAAFNLEVCDCHTVFTLACH